MHLGVLFRLKYQR